jgi:hypothetical protein
MDEKTLMQVIEYACKYREDSEAAGKGTQFPTIEHLGDRFGLKVRTLVRAIDERDWPWQEGWSVHLYSGVGAAGGFASLPMRDWRVESYRTETQKIGMGDLAFTFRVDGGGIR